jgi:nucleoside recognition membrane protein YjiH
MGWLFNGVDSLNGNSIANFVMANILVTICISIPCASLFLPFLVDYGLVDFIGVFVRVIMRPVFKLPGRAAIIMVTAFLGNFSAGHIAVNDQYKTGRMTERESVCIDTSLSTVSVGFLMALATNTGLNNAELWGGKNYWNLFFWVAFLITLIVAFIGVRIPPLRGIPDNYYPGATPNPEQVIKKGIFSAAITEGLDMAQNQDNVGKRIKYYMIETMNVLGTVAAGTSFFGTFGVVLYTYTPIVRWLGYIFWPFFRIFGFKGQELTTATTGAMISFVEVTVPGLLVTTGVWSMRLRFMLAVLPVTSIIFLASFVPCCMGTEVPVKFWHLCVIWLERMILSIIITGIFAIILFPATMIA